MFKGGDRVLPNNPRAPLSGAEPVDESSPRMPSNQSAGSSEALPAEIRSALTKLDDRLVKVLHAGDIRLVRSAWLLAQPSGYRIARRQDLEALEASGASPSPLLSPEEAVALVREGNRSAGALTTDGPQTAIRADAQLPHIAHCIGFNDLIVAIASI